MEEDKYYDANDSYVAKDSVLEQCNSATENNPIGSDCNKHNSDPEGGSAESYKTNEKDRSCYSSDENKTHSVCNDNEQNIVNSNSSEPSCAEEAREVMHGDQSPHDLIEDFHDGVNDKESRTTSANQTLQTVFCSDNSEKGAESGVKDTSPDDYDPETAENTEFDLNEITGDPAPNSSDEADSEVQEKEVVDEDNDGGGDYSENEAVDRNEQSNSTQAAVIEKHEETEPDTDTKKVVSDGDDSGTQGCGDPVEDVADNEGEHVSDNDTANEDAGTRTTEQNNQDFSETEDSSSNKKMQETISANESIETQVGEETLSTNDFHDPKTDNVKTDESTRNVTQCSEGTSSATEVRNTTSSENKEPEAETNATNTISEIEETEANSSAAPNVVKDASTDMPEGETNKDSVTTSQDKEVTVPSSNSSEAGNDAYTTSQDKVVTGPSTDSSEAGRDNDTTSDDNAEVDSRISSTEKNQDEVEEPASQEVDLNNDSTNSSESAIPSSTIENAAPSETSEDKGTDAEKTSKPVAPSTSQDADSMFDALLRGDEAGSSSLVLTSSSLVPQSVSMEVVVPSESETPVSESMAETTDAGGGPLPSEKADGKESSKSNSLSNIIKSKEGAMIVLSTSLTKTSSKSKDDEVEIIDSWIIPHATTELETSSRSTGTSMQWQSALERVIAPRTQMCAQCKQVKQLWSTSHEMKLCVWKLGKSPLCSEACHAAVKRQAVEAAAQRECTQCHASLPLCLITWQIMDFCTEICLAQYQAIIGTSCAQCSAVVPSKALGKYCVRFGCDIKQFCGKDCLERKKSAVKACGLCKADLTDVAPSVRSNQANQQGKEFCSTECMITDAQSDAQHAACAVCGNVKPIAMEVLQGAKNNSLCSEPCYAAFKFVNTISEGRCYQCEKFFDKTLSKGMTVFVDERPLTMCSRSCMNLYVLENRRIVACTVCKVKKYNFDMIVKEGGLAPIVVCSLLCLKNCNADGSIAMDQPCAQCGIVGRTQYKAVLSDGSAKHLCSQKCVNLFKDIPPPPPRIYQNILAKPPDPVEYRNKAVICKPFMHNKGTFCRPMPCHKELQTDDSLNPPVIIPIPVPIYIPAPCVMYSTPYPVPIPIPLPIPIPIFIPTTRNSAKGILKEIRKIHEKMPTDPFEAELLMMAEMVAGDKKQDVTDSESDADGNDSHDVGVAGDVADSYSPEPVDASNSFGDDIMQMALFASDLAEPQVDMEAVLTSNTITPSQQQAVDAKSMYGAVPEESPHTMAMRGRKRPLRGGRSGGAAQTKRGRRPPTPPNEHVMHAGNMHHMAHMPPPEPQRIEVEKPDANMRLKYTFGVNAWRHWVMQKNSDLEKAMVSNRKIKPFKPDLLQLTADELNFSLCLFVKEVKKPNGQEYAPDTIYYLCLGIQQYLFENGRIDNIFTDVYYEKFTDCLDEVAKKFAALYNDSQYIVTRVEEEHLWESKQLGAHSPHVLLSTLMFFNTKHFNLVTVEEHMQLSFSHIMKHWKRNPNSPGVAKVPGSRNVLLRFYPPQAALEANSRKKKVYEQQENEDNPLRCPVKLYEFYLSKCPESVKTRNDVFYLLPERSCVPDSPVWYSTMALGKEPLMKMLHRVKMVKEINVALLTS